MALSQSFEFYDQRAAESAAEASTTELVNVRERALRSEKTWRGLAAQAKRVLAERAKADLARAERRMAEADQAAALASAENPSPA
jgi:replication fork clamp-binding protein CrfC